jgi:hypothetical protein
MSSPPWPYADKASAITNGVNISFWNTKTENGLFTSAPNTPFTKQKALSPIVRLRQASSKNFIKTTSKVYKVLEAAQADFYAMVKGELASE